MDGNSPGVQQTAGTPYNRVEANELAFMQAAGMTGTLGMPMNASDGYVYMGPDYEEEAAPGSYIGSTYGSGRQSSALFPIERASQEYYYLDDMQFADLITQTSRIIGYDARRNPTMIKSTWDQAVTGAAAYNQATGRTISPFGWLKMNADRMERAGMSQAARASGGGGSRSIVNLTNAADAQILVDNALQQYLGRAATPKERRQFLNTLNQVEQENPVIAGPGGSRGGTNPQLIAQEFARSRPDAAEYLANTQYTDWLQELLSQNPTGGVQSGL